MRKRPRAKALQSCSSAPAQLRARDPRPRAALPRAQRGARPLGKGVFGAGAGARGPRRAVGARLG
jgi:hypothetical protein